MNRNWAPAAPALACPVCHAAAPAPALLEDHGHVLHRCTACRACFYADRTPPDYANPDYDPVHEAFYEQVYVEQNCSIHHVTRFLFLVDDPTIDSVLDVGCGFGFAVDMASRALGWRAIGLDPAHFALAGARLLGADIRPEYLTADLELGPPFGLVVASEVIEHVPDPDAFLALLRARMGPGARLVLTTPDAEAIRAEASDADLVSILAIGTHLVLYSAAALERVLRRAGFAHVEVSAAQNNLVAVASDVPFRLRGPADTQHIDTYVAYLRGLVERIEPGTPLWNGAAGRLFALLAWSAPPRELHPLFARIAVAWRERYGIDLLRLELPKPLPEQAFVGADKRFTREHGPGRPINLGTVLMARAIMENRHPERNPLDVLRWARPASVHAAETARILRVGSTIDLDLRLTTWRARRLIVDCLAELAPEFELELLVGLGTPSAGDLQERIDLPPDMLAARMAPTFVALVQADRYDEAARLLPWLQDPEALVRLLAPDPRTMLFALFALGVLHWHAGRRAQAEASFLAMEREARACLGTLPEADDLYATAHRHVVMAAVPELPPPELPPPEPTLPEPTLPETAVKPPAGARRRARTRRDAA